ncbi:hypothetical protein [Phosphitispora fastidiosa]|uniref:hypothetical protein n=1 Tax=Phosphitispora fastidiosa TaxID=2837202 RepID=UPI001E3C3B74|nr:hypothetical protein [Phosphitispora fastidiosa]MBU7006342.1 hypothetical protein [Phosphitispora fastidiosa]
MNIFEFAKKLAGREMGHEITLEEEKLAKELGFVVVFGYSDDGIEFRGAIDDEAGCYLGKEIYLDKDGVFEDCNCECKYSKEAKKNTKVIEAVWCDGELAWSYKTDIPHAKFTIYEDDEPFCQGIVFDVKELRAGEIKNDTENSAEEEAGSPGNG